MEIGFQFEVIYKDNELTEVRVSAWNGIFTGSSDVYVSKNELDEFTQELRGIPRSPLDTRYFVLGTFSRESAGGGVSMRFRSVDGSGHAYLESKIQAADDTAGIRECVVLSLPIEASFVDSFVAELGRLERAAGRVALLKGFDRLPQAGYEMRGRDFKSRFP